MKIFQCKSHWEAQQYFFWIQDSNGDETWNQSKVKHNHIESSEYSDYNTVELIYKQPSLENE
jgi:hypothetical protein